MVDAEVCIRRAQPEEAEALTELIMRSKAHWGYDAAFLDACRADLTLHRESIERDYVVCAEVGGVVAGVAHVLMQDDGEAYLDDLFVEPAYMGQGVGKLLWGHAVEWAVAQGATAMVFGADPNARPFYERMGAVVVGEYRLVHHRRAHDAAYALRAAAERGIATNDEAGHARLVSRRARGS